MIRLVLFSPTLRVVSFTISVHEETTKLFPIVLLFAFLLLPFYFLPFPLRYFTPHRISNSDAIRNSISCLQAPQVRVCGGFIFVIPACDFFRKFVPSCGDTIRVLSICDSPFSFPFPWRSSAHPNHISISDAIRMSFPCLQAQQVGVG